MATNFDEAKKPAERCKRLRDEINSLLSAGATRYTAAQAIDRIAKLIETYTSQCDGNDAEILKIKFDFVFQEMPVPQVI